MTRHIRIVLTVIAILTVTALVVVLMEPVSAHEWDRPRDLAPVELVVPAILPADAPEDVHVHWFLAELEWINRGAHIPRFVREDSATRFPTRSNAPITTGVEQWRGIVAAYFGGNTDAALRVMACESKGDPTAYNPSTASGLFQIKTFWVDPNRHGNYAWIGTNLFDPTTNVAIAAAISGSGSSWSHWQCKP